MKNLFNSIAKCVGRSALAASLVSLAMPAALAGTTNTTQLEPHPGYFNASNCGSIYKVSVKTGTSSGAGTDSNISFKLKGNGKTYSTGAVNSKLLGDAFENGDTDTFKICLNSPAVGHVESLTVTSDNRYAGSDWQLASVTVTAPDGKNSVFKFNSWFNEDKATQTKKCSPCASGAWNMYTAKIKTGTDTGAGTDSNIYLTLADANGNRKRFRLNSMGSGNLFENGDTDSFTFFVGSEIGQVTAVALESDHAYSGSDWYVDTLTLVDKTGEEDVFEFFDWFKSDSVTPVVYGRPRYSFTNPRIRSLQAVEYMFVNNLGSNRPDVKTLTFSQSSERAVTVGNETNNTFSVSATVGAGYSPGDAAGYSYEASVTSSYENQTGKSAEDTKSLTQEVTQEVEVEADPQTFLARICTWTTRYQIYDINGQNSGLNSMGFITDSPKCAQSQMTFPDPETYIDAAMYKAMEAQYDPTLLPKVVSQLQAAGVTIEGVAGTVAPRPATSGTMGGMASPEQACFDMVQGKVAWNQAGEKGWDPGNIQNLCRGTTDPAATISCFTQQIQTHNNWNQGIAACKAS